MDHRAVEEFLFQEAHLLDKKAYEEWMDLWWDGPLLYWAPIEFGDNSEGDHLSLICDSRYMLSKRIDRLTGPAVLGQDPPTRMNRLVSNVTVLDDSTTGTDTLHVRSVFHLTELQRSGLVVWSGCSEHSLIIDGGRLRMTKKVIRLINSDQALPPLAFLL